MSSTPYTQPQPSDSQTQDQTLYEANTGVEHQNLELEQNEAYSVACFDDQQELQMGENIAYIPIQLHDEDQTLELRTNPAYGTVHTSSNEHTSIGYEH